MMLGIGTPSACDRSRTLTPDSTDTGPVGGGAGGRGSRLRCASWRACRCSREGRAPPWSMTTRRRRPPAPPPPRGRRGRFGLLPPLSMCHSSVKAAQLRADADVLAQDASEHATLGRALEAGEVAAGVGAAARLAAAGHEDTLAGRKPEKLVLRRAPAAARTRPRGDACGYSVSPASTGIPPVSSSPAARSGCGTTL